MELNEKLMNEKLLMEWLARYSTLSKEEYSIFFNIRRLAYNNLDVFYTMNKIILSGVGEFRDDDLQIQFSCYNNYAILYSSYGTIKISSSLFRETISCIVAIYEKIYPLGTVVDLKKEYFKGVLPIDDLDHIRVIIQARFVEYIDTLYIPYIGAIYPIGNMDTLMSNIHFTTKAIKNVLFEGYSNDEEIAYLFQKKNELLIEKNRHSTAFATIEELKSLSDYK